MPCTEPFAASTYTDRLEGSAPLLPVTRVSQTSRGLPVASTDSTGSATESTRLSWPRATLLARSAPSTGETEPSVITWSCATEV